MDARGVLKKVMGKYHRPIFAKLSVIQQKLPQLSSSVGNFAKSCNLSLNFGFCIPAPNSFEMLSISISYQPNRISQYSH